MSDDPDWNKIPNPYDAMTNDTPETAMRSFVDAMERSNAPHTIVPKGGETHMRFRAALNRLAAERQAGAVSDEELGKIAYYAACTVDTHEDYGQPDWDRLPEVDEYAQESHIVAARAVRAALGPVPQIPGGWELWRLARGGVASAPPWEAIIARGSDRRYGHGPTWLDALNNAIAAAKENGHVQRS